MDVFSTVWRQEGHLAKKNSAPVTRHGMYFPSTVTRNGIYFPSTPLPSPLFLLSEKNSRVVLKVMYGARE